MTQPLCRFCSTPLQHTFVDLGMSPLCESFLAADQLNRMEPFYPLHARVCDKCFLVQLEEYVTPADIFTEYAYFSSYSTSWIEHAKRYVDMIVQRLGLGAASFAVELASNDGYLLQHFARHSVPVLGVEPAVNVAKVAIEKGIPTISEFFGRESAQRLRRERAADLIIGNNVLAQVPDINDFVAGVQILLAPGGVVTMEFPHLVRLMAENQFDTIYHEHFSYFSLYTAERIFAAHGMTIFDVEELPTHGGSLRIYARHAAHERLAVTERMRALRATEAALGIDRPASYRAFDEQVQETKRCLLDFLIAARRNSKTVVGYGAPGKGNTLLNYCGIRTDFVDYTVDRNPYKHGRFTPGTHIPIYDVERIAQTRPDFLLILPWNLRDEIVSQTSYIREWGGRHVVPIPKLAVIE